MTQYYLTRFRSDFDGTFGKITDTTGTVVCYTCELSWNNNLPKISCIPLGVYNTEPHNSADHPNTWEVLNVPGRSNILIHNGNTEKDSEGCILVGDSIGEVNGLPAVLNSVATLEKLRTIFPSHFLLEIKEELL